MEPVPWFPGPFVGLRGFELVLLWEVVAPEGGAWGPHCPLGHLRAVPRLECDPNLPGHVEAYAEVALRLKAMKAEQPSTTP
jgi:hypothetical protein